MRLSLFIALRYLFSKKKINAINIITGIAMLGFGVGAFAMVVILSTFNGLENIIEGMINKYDPDLKIMADGKKVYAYSQSELDKIRSTHGVVSITQVLEEKVVIKYKNRQEIAKIKGVDTFFDKARFDSLILIGSYYLGDSLTAHGVFGDGLASKVGLMPNAQHPVSVYVPKRGVEFNSLNPSEALSTSYIRASGIFGVHEEIDNEVFITSLQFARELLDYTDEATALELQLADGVTATDVRETLMASLGDAFTIKTRKEQNELIYKIFSSEKWITYAILALVLVISSFNIFGSLIMLVLDKKKDIGILKSMGATAALIRRTFIWQGNYIATFGGLIGIILGVLLVKGQEHFGWLQMDQGIVDAYPVEVIWTDVLLAFATVFILGLLISIYPANKAAKVDVNNAV